MKKLFMLSLAALVFAPVVYAQQPAQSSELAKFAPPMIPHPIAAYIPITPEKNACVINDPAGNEHQHHRTRNHRRLSFCGNHQHPRLCVQQTPESR